jgi:hypothetical protein
VILLLGNAGAGKSVESFRCLEHAVEMGYHPIRIELKRFSETTVSRCIDNTLQDDFSIFLK